MKVRLSAASMRVFGPGNGKTLLTASPGFAAILLIKALKNSHLRHQVVGSFDVHLTKAALLGQIQNLASGDGADGWIVTLDAKGHPVARRVVLPRL